AEPSSPTPPKVTEANAAAPTLAPAPERPAAASDGPAPLAPVRATDPAHAVLQLALAEPTLQLQLHPRHVQLALETEAAGRLELDVRVREGRAEVRVDGPASPLLARGADELREVLRHEGVALGSFSHGEPRHERREEAAELRETDARPPRAAAGSVKEPTPEHRHEGRMHVEA
ncbi:MAG: hypothetical protein K1X89_11660, partial [Myxococcaceae bacterium]|nr:hypothetical protein [Myxococcaceae bacterium]